MPQPHTKANILAKLRTERKRLDQNLARLSREEMTVPGVIGAWSVKDILAHLADWEAHMPVWIAAARRGDPVAEIEAGLCWKQIYSPLLATQRASICSLGHAQEGKRGHGKRRRAVSQSRASRLSRALPETG